MASKRLAKKKEVNKAVKPVAAQAEVKVEAVETVVETAAAEPVVEAPKAAEAAEEAPKKAVKKAAPAKTQKIVWQYGEKEWNEKDILDRVKAVWTGELGHKVKDLIDLEIYVKPEDDKAYYVFNNEINGSVEL